MLATRAVAACVVVARGFSGCSGHARHELVTGFFANIRVQGDQPSVYTRKPASRRRGQIAPHGAALAVVSLKIQAR